MVRVTGTATSTGVTAAGAAGGAGAVGLAGAGAGAPPGAAAGAPVCSVFGAGGRSGVRTNSVWYTTRSAAMRTAARIARFSIKLRLVLDSAREAGRTRRDARDGSDTDAGGRARPLARARAPREPVGSTPSSSARTGRPPARGGVSRSDRRVPPRSPLGQGGSSRRPPPRYLPADALDD